MELIDILTLMGGLYVAPDRLIAAGKPLLHELCDAKCYSRLITLKSTALRINGMGRRVVQSK
jgi:hypothetical protein